MWQHAKSASVRLLWLVVFAACGDNSEPIADAAIERCAPTTCRNDGECTNTTLGVRCACASGFTGDRCELAAWSLPPPTRALDLLFVVDNSHSMEVEQQRLIAAFDDLVATLTEIGGVLPDLHVGVVSSNAGSAGQSGVPGCPVQGDGGALQAVTHPAATHCPSLADAFASDIATATGRQTNYTGTLTDTFACLAALGEGGCGFEMHLESAWLALQPGKNPGFYRDDAHLAVVIVADEDDCSTRDGALFGDPTAGVSSPLGPRTSFRCHEFGVVCDDDATPRAFGPRAGCRPITAPVYEFPIAKYVDFFADLKPDRRLSVAGILGTFDGSHLEVIQDPAPGAPAGYAAVKRSCGYDANDDSVGASPPVRLAAFLGAFGSRGIHGSACDPSYADTLRAIGTEVATSMASILCLDAAITDPQTRCTVELATPAGTAPLPRCTEGATAACWTTGTDARACSTTETALWLTVDPAFAPPAGATLEVRCEAP